MGPNSGKSNLAVAQCLVRALLSSSPVGLSNALDAITQLKTRELFDGPFRDKWVELIDPSLPGKKAYLYQSSSGAAKSSNQLPEGATVGASVEVITDPNHGGSLLYFLEKLVANIEHQNRRHFRQKITGAAHKKRNDHETIRAEEIANLKRSLEACDPKYNALIITDFRKKLKDAIGKEPKDVLGKMLGSALNIPIPVTEANVSSLLNSLFRELKTRREKHCVDGLLFGAILTIMEILKRCSKGPSVMNYYLKLSDTPQNGLGLENDQLWLPINFFQSTDQRLLWPLRYGDKGTTEPAKILIDTTWEAIQAGQTERLLEIAYEYQGIVSDNIEKALNSKTIDENLDVLYDTLPYACSAQAILSTVTQVSKLSDSESLRANRAFCWIKEAVARLSSDSFVSQVIDLLYGDGYWKGAKADILRVKREKGEEEANFYASVQYVEGKLICPRSLIPELLKEDL